MSIKILICSDSHGDVDTMCGAAEKEKPDMILYLGDGIADAEELSAQSPNIEMIKVPGNVDSQKEDEEWMQYTEICGKRFMMMHGHTFFTGKEMTQNEMAQARLNILDFMSENNVDITLHGHIHEPFAYYHRYTQLKRGWIMCPGRIGRYNDSVHPTYGVLNIEESGALEWRVVEVE